MTATIEKPALNGVNTPTLLATINAVGAQPELAQFKFRARASWVAGTHSRIVVDDFYGAGQEHQARGRDRGRRRPSGRARRRRQRPDPGRVPAAGPRRLPDRRHRQHRRGPRRDAPLGGVDRRGRHRPPRPPRPQPRGPQRLFRHPRQLQDPRRRAAGEARPDRRAEPRPLRRLRRADERRPRSRSRSTPADGARGAGPAGAPAAASTRASPCTARTS